MTTLLAADARIQRLYCAQVAINISDDAMHAAFRRCMLAAPLGLLMSHATNLRSTVTSVAWLYEHQNKSTGAYCIYIISTLQTVYAMS
jgi:hypothetical protein